MSWNQLAVAVHKRVVGNGECAHVCGKSMGHSWGTTRGDSLVANRRQNKGL
jgi:hypothetical protein